MGEAGLRVVGDEGEGEGEWGGEKEARRVETASSRAGAHSRCRKRTVVRSASSADKGSKDECSSPPDERSNHSISSLLLCPPFVPLSLEGIKGPAASATSAASLLHAACFSRSDEADDESSTSANESKYAASICVLMRCSRASVADAGGAGEEEEEEVPRKMEDRV